ncbi:Protein THO1 [Vespula squamosa]|uniref:Protein THO1 n=1 Tax=Vespula squamosa TaxID=30214 RepID=A0ABD2BW55_VESSQ
MGKTRSFLRTAYNLEDNMTKILIGMRLKEKALEWFHSKPEFIEMTSNNLLVALKGIFYHRQNRIGFTSKESLLAAFEKITVRDKNSILTNSDPKSREKFNRRKYKSDKYDKYDRHEKDVKTVTGEKKESSDIRKTMKRCYNCVMREEELIRIGTPKLIDKKVRSVV